MRQLRTLLTLALVTASPLRAQDTSDAEARRLAALVETHKGDFDYLLGDWRFTARSSDLGEFAGVWSAVRLSTGGGAHVLDEYRVTGEQGETYYVSSTLRAYNAVRDVWELVSAADGDGLQDVGTAKKVGDEMHIEQRFGVASGNPAVWRIRYYDIRPDRFSWTADRSLDGGATWQRGHMQLEARRIGPARELGPVAKPSVPASAPVDSVSTMLRSGFATVSDWVTRAADLVPPDRYDFRPVDTVRTFGQLVGHLADSYIYYCGLASGRDVQWADTIANGSTDKGTMVRELAEATATCAAAYEAVGEKRHLMENVAHTHLHYGNMATYLRVLGLVPPSS